MQPVVFGLLVFIVLPLGEASANDELIKWLRSTSACTSAAGLNLTKYYDRTQSWEWRPQEFVVLTLCGVINQSCGISGKCTAPECCAMCQLWDSDGQQDGACIGTTFSKFENKGDEILMYYVGGDMVLPYGPGPAGPRVGLIRLRCAKKFTMSDYQESQGINSEGAYQYNITVGIPELCSACYQSKLGECATCTSESSKLGCIWCMDSNSCVNEKSTCQNYIKSPGFCPTCKGDTCGTCLSTNGTQCAWCLEGKCVSDSDKSTCQGGVVENGKYCNF